MTVIKRDKQTSSRDLVRALDEFIQLLKEQSEDDAVDTLKQASRALNDSQPGSEEHRVAVSTVIDAFDGDHELNAYILEKSNPQEWDISQQLSQAGSRVLSLARRLVR